MLDILSQLAPVIIYFVTGIAIRYLTFSGKSHGELLLKLVFTVPLPLLIVSVLGNTVLDFSKIALPLAAIVVSLASMLLALLGIRWLSLDRKSAGTLLLSTMIMNSLFMFPFIVAVYGNEGLADALLFELGNVLLMATYVYTMAFKYGDGDPAQQELRANLIRSPLIWAYLIGIVLSLTGMALPAPVVMVIEPLAQMTMPLILIALGMFVSFKLSRVKLVLLTLFIRMGMGVLFGIAIANYMGIREITFIVICLSAAAPVGLNAFIYSSQAKLDAQFSASTVSLSLLAGLVYMPLLILFFGA